MKTSQKPKQPKIKPAEPKPVVKPQKEIRPQEDPNKIEYPLPEINPYKET